MKHLSIHPTAVVSPLSKVAPTAVVWHNAQVREGANIGERCVIGSGAYIGVGVLVGEDSKIQNHALIYEPASIAAGVFVGPGVVLTNDHNPRALNTDGRQKTGKDWEPTGVTVEYGASIGARSVCIAPLTIGKWSMIGAGSVVTRDVPNYALMVGSPARQIGWVGESGERLVQIEKTLFRCAKTGRTYKLEEGVLDAQKV